MLNTDKKLENGALFIALEGRLDTQTSPDFNAELQPLLGEANTVTLDLEKLEYISSAGLRVLLLAAQIMEDKHAEPVKLLNCSRAIIDIFDLTGFTALFNINP